MRKWDWRGRGTVALHCCLFEIMLIDGFLAVMEQDLFTEINTSIDHKTDSFLDPCTSVLN